jgi:hypothetical protein
MAGINNLPIPAESRRIIATAESARAPILIDDEFEALIAKYFIDRQ